jgi:TonB family protein
LNKITKTALLLIALVSASTLCLAQTSKPSVEPPPPPTSAVEYNPNAWKEFVSKEGGFSVRMPAEPRLLQQETNTPLGKLPTFLYVAQTGARGHMVAYTDFPQYSESPDFVSAVLNGARDKVVASDSGRKLLSEKEVTIGAYSGREWLVADDQLLYRAETFLAKGRLYQLLLVAPLNFAFSNGRASADAADRTDFYEDISKRFFGSFKMLPAGASAEGTTQGNLTPVGEPKVTPAEPQTEGEVDRLLKSLNEKGELVVGVCAEGDKCKPLAGVDGVTTDAERVVVTIKVINKPQPVYPPIAKAARAQGTVTVQVIVNEEGRVIAAQAVSGHPLLQAAAVKAARGVSFSPILLGTKPVKVSGVITYNFVLQ